MRQFRLRAVKHREQILPILGGMALILAFGSFSSGLRGETRASSVKNAYAVAYDEAVQSVVSIRGEKKFEVSEMQKSPIKGTIPEKGKRENVTGMGTGVVVDERGYIVTNYHVVKGLQKIQITTSDETLYRDVEFVSYDPKTDLALLKIAPIEPMKPIKFGRMEEVYVCEDVMAIGNPFGYSGAAARGIVSGLNRPLTSVETASYDSVIQTDAAINPGNSGGPLVNLDGEMIGINAAVRDDAQNIAFAIPVDLVEEVVERMLRMSVAKMTHHGLTLAESDTQDAVLVVQAVEPNSPADNAGITAGDILLESNHRPVHTPLDFTRSLIGLTFADQIELTVSRDGQEETASLALSQLGQTDNQMTVAVNRPVTAAEKPSFQSAAASPSYAQNAGRAPAVSASLSKEDVVYQKLGIKVEPVSESEYKATYPNLEVVSMDNYKIMPAGGVRITSVQGGTVFSAGKSIIQKGDLIFGLVISGAAENRWEISSLDNLYFIARKWDDFAAENAQAKVYLVRNGMPYFLDIPIAAEEWQ